MSSGNEQLINTSGSIKRQRSKRFGAFVEKADNNIEKVEAQTYETATVDRRTTKADRIAAKGKYIMAKHDQHRTVIGYVLESPSEIGDVQNVFNITKEASFSVVVKNPKEKSPTTSICNFLS
ncbi:unnamed protein product [Rotaria sp. Silwood2]|nr:unnamed protein product [Rotaria sp. Silwood2]